jgi:PRTRC genetic system protein C
MQVTKLKRQFKYNGLTLADPAPNKPPEAVKAFYASMYPELTSAVVGEPTTSNGTTTYEFTRAVGTKG